MRFMYQNHNRNHKGTISSEKITIYHQNCWYGVVFAILHGLQNHFLLSPVYMSLTHTNNLDVPVTLRDSINYCFDTSLSLIMNVLIFYEFYRSKIILYYVLDMDKLVRYVLSFSSLILILIWVFFILNKIFIGLFIGQ